LQLLICHCHGELPNALLKVVNGKIWVSTKSTLEATIRAAAKGAEGNQGPMEFGGGAEGGDWRGLAVPLGGHVEYLQDVLLGDLAVAKLAVLLDERVDTVLESVGRGDPARNNKPVRGGGSRRVKGGTDSDVVGGGVLEEVAEGVARESRVEQGWFGSVREDVVDAAEDMWSTIATAETGKAVVFRNGEARELNGEPGT
jgi:hypothetical protein